MGVLRLGGGGVAWGGAIWITLTMSRFSTIRMMKNAVGTNSIPTSGPELWGFVLSGSSRHCGSWGKIYLTKTRRTIPFQVANSVFKFKAKKTSRF